MSQLIQVTRMTLCFIEMFLTKQSKPDPVTWFDHESTTYMSWAGIAWQSPSLFRSINPGLVMKVPTHVACLEPE